MSVIGRVFATGVLDILSRLGFVSKETATRYAAATIEKHGIDSVPDAASAADFGSSETDPWNDPFDDQRPLGVNPANGLSMMAGGALDVAGNLDGTDSTDPYNHLHGYHRFPGVNPASGLPMMDGGLIDVAGNLYGTDSRDQDISATDHWSSQDDSWHSFGGSSWGSGDPFNN